MTDKPQDRIFAGQATEHEGRFGKYLTLRMGITTWFIEPSKTPGKHNVYIKASPQQERTDAPKPKQQEPFGIPDESIPF